MIDAAREAARWGAGDDPVHDDTTGNWVDPNTNFYLRTQQVALDSIDVGSGGQISLDPLTDDVVISAFSVVNPGIVSARFPVASGENGLPLPDKSGIGRGLDDGGAVVGEVDGQVAAAVGEMNVHDASGVTVERTGVGVLAAGVAAGKGKCWRRRERESLRGTGGGSSAKVYEVVGGWGRDAGGLSSRAPGGMLHLTLPVEQWGCEASRLRDRIGIRQPSRGRLP